MYLELEKGLIRGRADYLIRKKDGKVINHGWNPEIRLNFQKFSTYLNMAHPNHQHYGVDDKNYK